MSRVDDITEEVSALCARYSAQDVGPFLRQLLAHYTRQLNLHAKGRATPFTPIEIDEIIEFLEHKLTESRHD
jgi:hypothetical protein